MHAHSQLNSKSDSSHQHRTLHTRTWMRDSKKWRSRLNESRFTLNWIRKLVVSFNRKYIQWSLVSHLYFYYIFLAMVDSIIRWPLIGGCCWRLSHRRHRRHHHPHRWLVIQSRNSVDHDLTECIMWERERERERYRLCSHCSRSYSR